MRPAVSVHRAVSVRSTVAWAARRTQTATWAMIEHHGPTVAVDRVDWSPDA